MSARPDRTTRAAVAAALAAVLVLGVGCAAEPAAAPASSSTSSDPSSTSTGSVVPGGASALVGPDRFAERIEQPGVVTIDVHVPDEGFIAGTDLVIPFDRIATSSELPADRTTPLAVYCRSGNMSAQAVADLAAMGYTDIVELDGGFTAWEASGRPLRSSIG